MRRQQEILIQADLHVHTKYSADSSINPKTLAEQLHSHTSIKAVAITDHDMIEGYFKVQELAASYTDVLIIPGAEITTPEGDMLVLGITELPPKPWNVEDVIDFSKEERRRSHRCPPVQGVRFRKFGKELPLLTPLKF